MFGDRWEGKGARECEGRWVRVAWGREGWRRWRTGLDLMMVVAGVRVESLLAWHFGGDDGDEAQMETRIGPQGKCRAGFLVGRE